MRLNRSTGPNGSSLILLLALLWLPTAGIAQYGCWEWSNGLWGGRVFSLARGPSGVLYAGADEGGGLYFSEDGGNTWQRSLLSSYPPPVTCVTVDQCGCIFVGTDSGILRSTDHGLTWTSAGFPSSYIYSLFTTSMNGVLVGLWLQTHLSTDHGDNWTLTNLSRPARAFAQDSIGNILVGCSAGAIHKSTDFGFSWMPIGSNTWYTTSLVVNQSGYIFAATERDGVFRSTDEGVTWSSQGLRYLILRSLIINQQGHIFVSDINNWTIAPATGIHRSTDNGSSWTSVNNGLQTLNISALLLTPTNNVVAGSRGDGVYLSTDDGNSWTKKALTNTFVYGIAATPANLLFASTYFSGVFRSTDKGISWIQMNTGLKDWIVRCVASDSTGVVFVGTDTGGVFRSTDDGNSWAQRNDGMSSRLIYSLAVTPTNQLYAGTYNGIYRSTNGGDSWGFQGLNNYAVFSLAVNSMGHVFAGTMVAIFRSTDTGNSWIRCDSGTVSGATYSFAFLRESVFAGIYGRGVYRSTDNGQTWNASNGGLANLYVTPVIAISDSELAVGTSGGGVYSSTDCGLTWSSLACGLSNSRIRSLGMSKEGTLLAGTFGTGVFRYNPTVSTVPNPSLPPAIVPFLYQNYPNPFNPTTKIEFLVSDFGFVSLKVYDVLGREVATLVNEEMRPGEYERTLDAGGLSSGIYFYRLQAGSFVETKKLAVVK